MKLAVRSVLLAAAFLAGACTYDVSVLAPDMTDAEFSPQTKTPGHFAVMIQSGAWKTTVKAKGFVCSAMKFPTDFETGYAQAAREGFEQAFESVIFITTALKPEQLKSQKLDAQIIVSQASVIANFSLGGVPIFSNNVRSEVALDGIVRVMSPDGLADQRTIKASGDYTIDGAGDPEGPCSEPAAAAINLAGGAAIKTFVLNSVNGAKLDVVALMGKKTSAKPVN